MRANRIWVVAAAVTLLGLSGCVRVHADFIIQPDDTVDGVMTMAVSGAYLTAEGYAREDVISGIKPLDYEGWPGTISAEGTYQQDDYYGYQIAFTQGTLAEFSSGNELAVTRVGDVFSFRGDLTEDLANSGLSEREAETADLRFSVTFPGEVLEHNGSEVVGNTVVWVVNADSEPVLEARGSAVANGLAAPYRPESLPVAPTPDPDYEPRATQESEVAQQPDVAQEPEEAPEPDAEPEPDVAQVPRDLDNESAAAPEPDNADSSLSDGANEPAGYVVSGLVLVLLAGLGAYVLIRRRGAKA